MVKRKVHFTLDCAKPGSQFTVEGLHVGDKRSCEFHILLRNGIVPLSFDDENIAVIMNAQKPDGTTISTLCNISEDKKEVVYTLDVQDTTVAGIVNYELIIAAYDGENYCVLYSATFSTVVSTGVIVPVFKKLDSEPDDWATGYKKYFRHTQNGYEKITDDTCPTFNSNDFYFLVNPNYDSENDYSAFEQTVANVQSLLLRVGAVEAKNAEQDTTIEGKAAANHTHSEYVTDADISGKEDKANKVASNMASIDGNANMTKYPSVYAVREYLSNYFYSRSEIDRSTYTKDEVDTALGGKADIADIPFATPEQYGAKGDGVTDDTAAIQAAINDNDLIYFPQGTYIIDTSSHRAGTYGLVIPSNKTLILDENAVLKQKELPLFKDGRAVDYAFMLHIPNNASNVTIKGGKIIGDRVYKLETLSEIAKADCLSWYGGSYGHHMGIRLEHCSNVLIEGVTIEDMSGDGISITATGAEYCENITIRNCDVRRSWRNGINIGNCQNIKIEDCTINDSGCNLLSNGSEVVRADVLGESGASAIIERKLINGETGKLCGWPPMCGIDIETDSPVQMPTKQVYIRNCIFTGNAQNDIDICNGCDEVYIDSCNCETGITSAREAITGLEYKPTDKIVISNSVIGEINLHGERAVGCVITGKAMSYNDGSVFKGCHINKVQMSVNLPSATHYFEGCEIDALNMPTINNTKCVFQNCTFTIKYTGSRNYFNGNNRLDSCSVYITSSLSTTYSIFGGSAISATNTAFIVIITGANINGGLFASDESPRNLILLDCDFDIPSGLKLYEFPGENKVANIKVCGCTFAYKNSFDISSAPGLGTRVFCANTFSDTAATTLAAYGITDAYTKTEVDNLLSGSQIVSGVVNANGTITFTDSDGNTFTTSGSSVIGADGFSPVATVTQTASGATVSITDSTGTTTANISNGADGQDYVLTAQDKSDIANIVLSELPNADTMSF